MIHFVGGKPGGGKTLFTFAHKLVEELMTTERACITNISIKWDLLQEYINEKHPKPFLLETRLRILQEEEVYTFFLHRLGRDLAQDAEGLPVFGEPDKGCVYYLDEIHIFFNAREWKKTGAGALYYLSQHRKLGDDVFCITQAISNVDKQFRSIAQDFTYITNERTQTFRGFRKGSGFVAKTFLQPANGVAGEVPMEIHRFPLDLERAALYDTAGGVGITSGNRADLGKKAKGLPLKWLLLAIPLGVILLYFLLNLGMKAGTKGLVDLAAKSPQVPKDAPSPTLLASAAFGSGGFPVASPGQPGEPVELFPTGYVVFRDRVTVQMSDGTTRIESYQRQGKQRGEVTRIERNAVYLGEEKHFLRPAPRPQKAIQETAQEAPEKAPGATPGDAAPVPGLAPSPLS